MNKIRIFAVLAALLTAVSVYFYLSSLNKPVPVVLVDVIVANQAIGIRTEITADMVKTIQLPPSAVHPNAVRSASDVVGTIAGARFEAEEQILNTKIVKAGDVKGGMSYLVEKGMRAMTISVDPVTGVAGYVAANDIVDILAAIDVSTLGADGTTQTVDTYSFALMQNIKVLASGTKLQNKAQAEDVDYATITVLVTPEQAIKLNLASLKGTIRLILRSPLDAETPVLDPEIAKMLIE